MTLRKTLYRFFDTPFGLSQRTNKASPDFDHYRLKQMQYVNSFHREQKAFIQERLDAEMQCHEKLGKTLIPMSLESEGRLCFLVASKVIKSESI